MLQITMQDSTTRYEENATKIRVDADRRQLEFEQGCKTRRVTLDGGPELSRMVKFERAATGRNDARA